MGSGEKDKEPKQKKKPGRVPTSCAECRRLKLRCDRNVPCEKCVSRGCGSICPNGVLTPGKNNRMILANTEELHDRIDLIMARNRELENALRALQDTVSDQPHPLLSDKEHLNLGFNVQQGSSSGPPSTSSSSKSPSAFRISPAALLNDDTEMREEKCHGVDTFGTLCIGRRGESRYLGHTARSEYLTQTGTRFCHTLSQSSRLSKRMLEVSLPDFEIRDESLLYELLDLLPSHSEALYFCDLYLEYGNVLYSPISRKELFDEILAVVYRARQYSGFDQYHYLALIFIIFAFAELFNPKRQPYAPEAHEYYHLSRVALHFSPPTNNNTLEAVQSLIHMAQFLELSEANSDNPEIAWSHIRHAMCLAQSMGLHLNSTRWKLAEEVSQKRHDLFWRLFASDTCISAHLGRPPGIPLIHIDVPRPPNPTDISADSATLFHAWNVHFSLLLSSIMEIVLVPKQPAYTVLLRTDRKIRDFEIHSPWRIHGDAELQPPDSAMYRWLALSVKEIALVNLHRGYFAEALQEAPEDLQKHQYLPSVVAIYRSAWRVVHGLTITWIAIPKFLARVSMAWSHGLSAAILFCLLVTRAPSSHFTSSALDELDNLTALFDSAAMSCHGASKLLSSVKNLRRKAHESTGPPGRFYPTDDNHNFTIPELERLNGKTSLLSEHRMSLSTSVSVGRMLPATSGSTPLDMSSSRATSATISDVAEGSHTHSTPPKSLFHTTDGLHATLLHDLREFSLGTVATMNFFDSPSTEDSSGDVDMTITMSSPPPTTSQETARAKEPPPTPAVAHVHLRPDSHSYTRHHDHYPHVPLSPASPSEAPSPILPSHTHYFPVALQQEPLPFYSEPRRGAFPSTQTGGASPGFGMGSANTFGSAYGGASDLPQGFQSGWGTSFGHSPIVLDSSWSSLVEQLGF